MFFWLTDTGNLGWQCRQIAAYALHSMRGFNLVGFMGCNILISLRIRLPGNKDRPRSLRRQCAQTRRDEGLVGLQGFEPRTKGL
jgi:hypothetical protein